MNPLGCALLGSASVLTYLPRIVGDKVMMPADLNEHSSDGIRSVSLLPERKRQFAKPSLYPVRFDVREVLTVCPRCALVGAALGIGMGQDVLSADLVVQGVEAVARRPDKLWRSASAGRHIAISFGVPWRPRGAQ